MKGKSGLPCPLMASKNVNGVHGKVTCKSSLAFTTECCDCCTRFSINIEGKGKGRNLVTMLRP